MRPISCILAASFFAMATTSVSAVNFSQAKPLEPTSPDTDTNKFDRSPRAATDSAGNWVAVWETSAFGGTSPNNLDVAVSRSTDNGKTWTTPSRVVANEGIDDAMPSVATDGNGTWVCAYTSASMNNPPRRVVLTKKSTDTGATWSSPMMVCLLRDKRFWFLFVVFSST